MINQFWEWIYTTVNYALSVLNEMYLNPTMKPFFDLLILIVGLAVVIKFIVMPLLGNSIGSSDKAKDTGKSDKAKRKDEEE